MQRGADEASLVEVLLGQQRLMHEREEALRRELRDEAQAKQDELRQELQQQQARLREELQPAEAVSEGQLASLQARLDRLHAAELLGDEEVYALEDCIADFLELRCRMGGAVVTPQAACASEPAARLLRLVALREGANGSSEEPYFLSRDSETSLLGRRLVVRGVRLRGGRPALRCNRAAQPHLPSARR